MTVYLQCVNHQSKLRVRIISPGFLNTANCQFPRALREPGRYFSVPASSIRLVRSANTYFYRVKQPITVLDAPPTPEEIATSTTNIQHEYDYDIVASSSRPTPTTKPTPKRDLKNLKVFDSEDPDCAVCMDAPKEMIIVPCGHYCLCSSCSKKLQEYQRKCPMCRQPVECLVTADMVK